MSEFTEYATRYFDFLSERFGFQRTIVSQSHIRYATSSIYFDVTFNPRDGPDVDFGRLAQPGIEPGQTCERISIGTFLGAIQTCLRTYKEGDRPPEQELEALSLGLQQHAAALVAADPELYRLLRELRFWHVGHWTNSWGKTIIMSPEAIIQNRRLVPSIIRLLQSKAA